MTLSIWEALLLGWMIGGFSALALALIILVNK